MIGILGGTFDPVHWGHIHVALMALTHLPIDEVRFLPCKTPLLKENAKATTQQRLAMLQLALAPYAQCTIDTREVDRDTPSYMIETLRSLKHDNPQQTIALLLGMDAFVDLPRWHEWQHLLDYCHLVVVARPNSPTALSDALKQVLVRHRTEDVSALSRKHHGHIFFLPMEEKDIASTAIRHNVQAGSSPEDLLPASVLAYIHEQGLYTAN